MAAPYYRRCAFYYFWQKIKTKAKPLNLVHLYPTLQLILPTALLLNAIVQNKDVHTINMYNINYKMFTISTCIIKIIKYELDAT